jgi:hypothetical protein
MANVTDWINASGDGRVVWRRYVGRTCYEVEAIGGGDWVIYRNGRRIGEAIGFEAAVAVAEGAAQ